MMDKHIKFDWAMKRMLRNKANFDILEGFLSELLKFDVHIQEILESESNRLHPYVKSNRVDILVKNDRGDLMLIEVQNSAEYDYFRRMLYGQAKLISERLAAGHPYGELTRVYSINIVYFPLGVGEDYIYVSDGAFRGMHRNDELQLSPAQQRAYGVQEVREIFTQYYIIKVNEFDDVAKDTLDEWIYFLKNNRIEDSFQAKGLEKAKEQLRVDNMTPDERMAYDEYIEDKRVLVSVLTSNLENQRIEMEMELERVERKLATTIRMLLEAGVPLPAIALQLSISEEEARRLGNTGQ